MSALITENAHKALGHMGRNMMLAKQATGALLDHWHDWCQSNDQDVIGKMCSVPNISRTM